MSLQDRLSGTGCRPRAVIGGFFNGVGRLSRGASWHDHRGTADRPGPQRFARAKTPEFCAPPRLGHVLRAGTAAVRWQS